MVNKSIRLSCESREKKEDDFILYLSQNENETIA